MGRQYETRGSAALITTNASRCARWKARHLESARAAGRARAALKRAAIPEITRAADRARNPKRRVAQRAYERTRRATDPCYKLASVLRGTLRSALKGRRKGTSAVQLLGCTIEELRDYIASQFMPGMSWGNHGQWHIDHRIPLASVDVGDPLWLAAVMHFTNLQPLWSTDNLRKAARPVDKRVPYVRGFK